MTTFKGLRDQQQLFRWFTTLVEGSYSAPDRGAGEAALRLDRAIQKVRELVEGGWWLSMSSEGSPADKAGMDFLWEDTVRGPWFALDCSLREKMDIPRLIRLVRIKNATTTVGEVMSIYSKIFFLELLIELAEGPVLLTREMVAPPKLTPVADIRSALYDFRTRLRALKDHTNGDLFVDWAENLHRAIGFQRRKEDESTELDMNTIRLPIKQAVETYITTALRNHGEMERPKLKFGRKFHSYSPTTDTLHLPHKANPTVKDIKVMVETEFDARYTAELKKAGKLSDKLLALKRSFGASGYAWVINHLLDVLEAASLGTTAVVAAPKARVPSSTDADQPRATALRQRVETVRAAPTRLSSSPPPGAGLSGTLAAYNAVMMQRKAARGR